MPVYVVGGRMGTWDGRDGGRRDEVFGVVLMREVSAGVGVRLMASKLVIIT